MSKPGESGQELMEALNEDALYHEDILPQSTSIMSLLLWAWQIAQTTELVQQVQSWGMGLCRAAGKQCWLNSAAAIVLTLGVTEGPQWGPGLGHCVFPPPSSTGERVWCTIWWVCINCAWPWGRHSHKTHSIMELSHLADHSQVIHVLKNTLHFNFIEIYIYLHIIYITYRTYNKTPITSCF